METGECVQELVFPDLDLLQTLADETPPQRARVLSFRNRDSPAVLVEGPKCSEDESR